MHISRNSDGKIYTTTKHLQHMAFANMLMYKYWETMSKLGIDSMQIGSLVHTKTRNASLSLHNNYSIDRVNIFLVDIDKLNEEERKRFSQVSQETPDIWFFSPLAAKPQATRTREIVSLRCPPFIAGYHQNWTIMPSGVISAVLALGTFIQLDESLTDYEGIYREITSLSLIMRDITMTEASEIVDNTAWPEVEDKWLNPYK